MAQNRSRSTSALMSPPKNAKRKTRTKNHEPVLILTGNRPNDHFQILLHGNVVDLKCSELKVLLSLILAGGVAGTGFVRANPVIVCGLRKALENAVNNGTGKALIETGSKNEYRLTIPRDRMKEQVAITSCFFELVALGVISGAHARKLRTTCGQADCA